MPCIEYKGMSVEVDEDGFIADPSQWDEDLARFLAQREEGIDELTPDHWKVIYFLNKYFAQNGIAPMVRKLCRETGFELQYIFELFPNGPARGACKVAGLPKPTGCV